MIKEITNWIDHCKFEKDPKLWFKLINEEYKEVIVSIADKGLKQGNDKVDWDNPKGDNIVLKELADLIWVATGMIYNMGYNPEEILQKVVDSNNSKFCKTQAEALESIAKLSEQGVEAYADNVAPRVWVIRRKSDNKVLKGINYETVNWED